MTGDVSTVPKGLVLPKVVPFSLGIDEHGDIMAAVIERNTPVPAKAKRTLIKPIDNAPDMLVRVREGECVKTCANHLLREFWLTNLSPVPRGECEVNMTFKIGENGILHVSAVEKSTGMQNSIMTTNYRDCMSQREIGQKFLRRRMRRRRLDRQRSVSWWTTSTA